MKWAKELFETCFCASPILWAKIILPFPFPTACAVGYCCIACFTGFNELIVLIPEFGENGKPTCSYARPVRLYFLLMRNIQSAD